MRLIYFYRLIQLSISIIRILVKMHHLVLSVSVSPLHGSLLVQSLSCVWLFATPRIAARQASLSINNSQSSPKLLSTESVMPSNHLILCHPLLLLPPIPPSIRIMKLWSFRENIRNEWKMVTNFKQNVNSFLSFQGPDYNTTWWTKIKMKWSWFQT